MKKLNMDTNNTEKTVIIILNYNQNDYTLKCIDSILKSSYKNFLLLAIDNGSTKENQDQLMHKLPKDERLLFKVVKENSGYVGGINFGLKEGAKLRPDNFLIMNNDTILDEKAIEELLKTYKKFQKKAIVTGKVYHYDDPKRLQFVGSRYLNKRLLIREALGVDELDEGQFDVIEERDMLDDIFWMFPSELYKRIGGYSPYFWFNSEQADFALRAKKEGYKLVYTPYAKLWHKGSVSIGGRDYNPRLAYWTVQSKLILKYLHLSRIDFLGFYINTLYSILRTFIKSIVHRFEKKEDLSKYALAKYKGLMYFNKWLLKRNENTGYNPF